MWQQKNVDVTIHYNFFYSVLDHFRTYLNESLLIKVVFVNIS